MGYEKVLTGVSKFTKGYLGKAPTGEMLTEASKVLNKIQEASGKELVTSAGNFSHLPICDTFTKVTKGITDTEKVFSGMPKVEEVFKDLKPHLIPPAKKALMGADKFLRQTGAKIEAEVPIDTFLASIPKKQRKAVARLLGKAETVRVKTKHNKNGGFSILGFQAKRGEEVVGQGALSITNFGKPDAVAKWRISSGKKGKKLGNTLRANGFVDCAQNATPEQLTVVPSFVKKMLGLDTNAGKAATSHIRINGSNLLGLLPEGNLGNLANIQESFNKLMEIIRKNIATI